MGAGFVILIWGIVFGICIIIWLVLASLTLLGWKRNKRWLTWSAGIPTVFLLILGIKIAGFITYGILRSTNPRAVFEDTFGVPPAPSVSEIKSELYWFADTGSIYLRFRISEKDFRKIIPNKLTERTMQEMKEDVPFEFGSQYPKWWAHSYNNNWIYLLKTDDSTGEKPGRRRFYSETEYFAYDPKAEIAYYRFLGID